MASPLEKYVECPVCFHLFQGPTHQPLALSCMHTLCRDCYLQIKSQNEITCPMCNAVSDVTRVKPDFRTQSLVDDYLKECKDDEGTSTCEICKRTSNQTPEMCTKCKINLCKVCSKSHKGKCSRKVLVSPGFGRMKQFSDMKQQLETMRDSLEQRCHRLQRKLKKLDKTERNALKKINAAEQQVIREVKEHFESLRTEVENAKESLYQQLESEQEAENQKKMDIDGYLRKLTGSPEDLESDDDTAYFDTGKDVVDVVDDFLSTWNITPKDQDHVDFSVEVFDGEAFDVATATQVHITADYHSFSGDRRVLTEEDTPQQPLCPTAPIEENIPHVLCDTKPQVPKRKIKPVISRAKTLPLLDDQDVHHPIATGAVGNPISGPKPRLDKNTATERAMYSRDREVKLDGVAYRLVKYKDEIWCNTSSELFLFTSNCELVKKISMQGVNDVRAMVKVNAGGFIVLDAGYKQRSLKLLDKQGNHTKTLLAGQFSDVSFHNNVLYALEQEEKVIYAFKQTVRNTWQEWKQIKLSNCTAKKLDTMCVFEECIFISSSTSHSVCIFNINGRLLAQYGKSGDDIAGMKGGLLKYPRLCGRHSSGQVLVADCFNERLQVLSTDGTWKVLHLGDAYGTTWDAVQDFGQLFVLHFFGRKHHIVKYTQAITH